MYRLGGTLLRAQEIAILCEQGQDGGAIGDNLPVCNTLDQTACNVRSNCDWTPKNLGLDRAEVELLVRCWVYTL